MRNLIPIAVLGGSLTTFLAVPAFAWIVALSIIYSVSVHAEILFPGETLTLTSTDSPQPADGQGGDCEFILLGQCGFDSQYEQFGVRAIAKNSFSRGEGIAYQYYEFEIDGGDGAETALVAQISGAALFNGFIALVGGGQVSGKLHMKLVDLGLTGDPYPNGGKVVHKEKLASHELKGIAIAGPSLEVTVEGGAPYIGVGGSPGLTFTLGLQKELVRDKAEFGAHVLLLRGHTYRLVFDVNALAKKGAVAGLSIAQFKLGDDRVPDIIDPQNWLDGVNQLLDTSIPKIGAKYSDMKEKEGGIFSLFSKPRIIDSARNFADANAILADSGLPTSFKDLVETRIKRSGILEERIDNPGAEVLELFVTLETDQVEILREHSELLRTIIELQNTPPGRRPDFPVKK